MADNVKLPVALEDRRESIVEQLAEMYANDAFDEEELERRMEAVGQAEDVATLDRVVQDLVPVAPAIPVVARPAVETVTALVPVAEVPQQRSVVAIFGAAQRKAGWTAARKLKVVTIFGGAELDFRDARLGRGVTDVRVTSVFGGVKIIVPPGLPVEVEGVGIMGAFEQGLGVSAAGEGGATVGLRVKGTAVFSGVEVEQRLPGESRRQAQKRLKKERKALAAAEQQKLLGPGRED